MRSTFKVLFYVNGSKGKDGIVPIMRRITINGSVAQFSCKRVIPKAIWDVKGNRAKGKSKEAIEINYVLENIKAQIIKHYQRISDRKAFVSAETMRYVKQPDDISYDVYSLEMVIAVAFRICSKESMAFRRFVMDKVCARQKGTQTMLFFPYGKGSNLWYC